MLLLTTGEPGGKRTRRHAPVRRRSPWGTMSVRTGPCATPCHATPCHTGQRHQTALSVYLPSIRRGCSPLLRLGADFYRGFAWPLAKRFTLTRPRLRFGCCALALCFHLFPAYLSFLAAAFSLDPASATARLCPALVRAEGASSAPKDSLFTPRPSSRSALFPSFRSLRSSFLQSLSPRLIFVWFSSLLFFVLIDFSYCLLHSVNREAPDLANCVAYPLR